MLINREHRQCIGDAGGKIAKLNLGYAGYKKIASSLFIRIGGGRNGNIPDDQRAIPDTDARSFATRANMTAETLASVKSELLGHRIASGAVRKAQFLRLTVGFNRAAVLQGQV
jgi:hypothetical protein